MHLGSARHTSWAWAAAPALLLALSSAAATAQQTRGTEPSAGIYTCIDDRGRKLTADRPIPECTGREQRILNRDGSLKDILPPTLTAEERAEKEALERKAALARAAQADAVRRDRNLMARYPSEEPHQRAREAALDTVRMAMRNTEQRLHELRLERKPLLDEAEFYRDRQLPLALRQQLDANDAATQAQQDAASNQQAELERINRLYDAELDRLRRLWAGASPGSLGPLVAAQDAGTPKRR